MWHICSQNPICNQHEKINEQRLHIERVLSIKGKTNSSCPYKPKFLKTKLKKKEMEEELQDKIEYENKNLLMRIIEAEIKPSKYNMSISCPADCPAFDKEKMLEKRIRSEFEKYKTNCTIYEKIAKVKPSYDTKEILKKSAVYEGIAKRILKADRVLHPCLYFKSPTYFKKILDKETKERIMKLRKNRPKSAITNKRKEE